ncbi:hypothetical protein HAZT_HAZT001699, partial [Hyalella azteca]
MKPDQDWTNVWPTSHSFKPATVPLPIRMGMPPSNRPTPDKWANAELMKIPNFLHLTPPAVERHCAAIQKYCSPWPEGVSYASALTEDTQNPDPNPKKKSKTKLPGFSPDPDVVFTDPGYFPMSVTKTSYLYSGPSIRDERARVAVVKVRLEDLQLDAHSYDKLLRLVGDRYDRASHTITLTGDRCPLYSQNLDYCMYLLTVMLAEAQTKEAWEHEKPRQDHESFEYSGSSSEAAVAALRERQALAGVAPVTEQQEQRYKEALNGLLNGGETDASVTEYGESVLNLLGISERVHDAVSHHNHSIDNDLNLPDISVKTYFERINVKWQNCGWYPKIP